MENLREVLEETINEKLYQMVMSNAKDKMAVTKVKVRPIMKDGILHYQASSFSGTKVLHKNYEKRELLAFLLENMNGNFKQLEIETIPFKIMILASKKGKLTIKKKINGETEERQVDFSHNRIKNYILEEGKPIEFLIDLGVQTKEGKTVRARYDKFKQINRFLEFIQDILPTLQKKQRITILDFGCGKSYLTFAMYYYLKILQGMDIKIIGLDLKEDVINTCNKLRDKYGYHELNFLKGDIENYNGVDKVDMVVTLHACDTATDYALQKAIAWNASVILSVPCCQHEVNRQISCRELEPVLKYGLIRERMSALITDAYRANILEKCGYDTQILEFIDMEHTPKNILIRAVKKENAPANKQEEIERLQSFLHINPTLGRITESSNNREVKKVENEKTIH